MSIPSLPSYAMPREPARNRVGWRPDARRAALLIHDMQDDFLSKYDVTQAPIPDLITAIVHLRERCRDLGIPVYDTAQPPVQPEADRALLNDFWGPGLTAPEHQDGARIVAALSPRPEDTACRPSGATAPSSAPTCGSARAPRAATSSSSPASTPTSAA